MSENRFPDCPFPRIDALFRAGERIWRRRSGVARVFPRIDTPEYWYWLMWYGPKIFDEIRRNGYAFPPRALIERVAGPGDWKRFNQSGLVDWRRIDACLRQAGADLKRGAEVLDFGCGCGRVLRHFACYAGRSRFHGCDVDPELVEWSALHYDFAEIAQAPAAPPLPYDDDRFDAIYAFSVFTHLPLDRALAWRDELARVARPGAILVITLHGQGVVDSILDKRRSLGVPLSMTLRRDLERFERDGHLFYPYPQTASFTAPWMRETIYGNAFVSEAFARDFWSGDFETLDYLHAPDDWQDYLVLRRA